MATDREEYLNSYVEYGKTLRAWLVAFGIGAPVLILSQDRAYNAFIHSAHPRLSTWLFLVGVLCQVFIAFINKTIMWLLYYGECFPAYKGNRRYKVCDYISNQYWIDLTLDVVSILCFIIATILVMTSIFDYKTPAQP